MITLYKKWWSIIFLLLSVWSLSACSTVDKNTNTNADFNVLPAPTTGEQNTETDMSVSSVPTILEEYIISDNFLLREYQIIGNDTDSWFAVINIESGTETEIRINGEMFLEKIIDENNIVFISNGKTSETVGRRFPERLYFERNQNDALFEMRSEPILFKDTDIVEVGSPKKSNLIMIQIEGNSISFDFGASDNSGSFYAGYVDIPMTTIRFDKDDNLLKLHFEDTWQMGNLQNTIISNTDNLIYGYDLEQSNSNLDVYVKLNDNSFEFYGQKDMYEDIESGKMISRLTLSIE